MFIWRGGEEERRGDGEGERGRGMEEEKRMRRRAEETRGRGGVRRFLNCVRRLPHGAETGRTGVGCGPPACHAGS